MIWVMAEARRLRQEAMSGDGALVHWPSSSGGVSPVESGDRRGPPDRADARDGVVVDWQLPPARSRHTSV